MGSDYEGEKKDESPDRTVFLGQRWPVNLPAPPQEGSSAAPLRRLGPRPTPNVEGNRTATSQDKVKLTFVETR